MAAPPEGVELLGDVDAPLLGERGAVQQFGPQKGASPDEVERLEAGLERGHVGAQLGADP
ncbi:MAG: glycerate kinase [Dermatophilaceae bacterium]